MKALLTLFLLVTAVVNAQARLGWTLEKCQEFYGADKTSVSGYF